MFTQRRTKNKPKALKRWNACYLYKKKLEVWVSIMPKLVKTSSFINRFVFSNKHRIFSLGLDVASCEKSVNICLIDSGQNFRVFILWYAQGRIFRITRKLAFAINRLKFLNLHLTLSLELERTLQRKFSLWKCLKISDCRVLATVPDMSASLETNQYAIMTINDICFEWFGSWKMFWRRGNNRSCSEIV